jgi:hypothetical protein
MWVAAAAVCWAAAPAVAVPLVSITGEVGVPGGTANALLALADDGDRRAAEATVDVAYPLEVLSTSANDCALAERLAGTHALSASVEAEGRIRLAILSTTGLPQSLGDGDLARCAFGIALGAPAGTAALALSDLVLRDTELRPIEGAVADGAIIVEGSPLPTATATLTPTAANTPTITATSPPTMTPSVTPTPTDTPKFFPTVRASGGAGGSCTITAAADASAVAALLWLAPALALWLRRRTHR